MLHFDILEDLSDDIKLQDYFHFLTINDLTYMLNYRIIKRVECYLRFPPREWVIDTAGNYNDLDAIKFFHKRGHIFTKSLVINACKDGYLDIVKWAIGEGFNDMVYLLDYASDKKQYHVMDWLTKNGYVEGGVSWTLSCSWDSHKKCGNDVLKWFYVNNHHVVLDWLKNETERLTIAKWLHVHCGYDYDGIVIDKP